MFRGLKGKLFMGDDPRQAGCKDPAVCIKQNDKVNLYPLEINKRTKSQSFLSLFFIENT